MKREDKDVALYIAYEDASEPDQALPEKNLLRAILLSAMNDLSKPGKDAQKAAEYFLNPDESYLFSFRSICDQLGIDPKEILKLAGLLPIAPRGPSAFPEKGHRVIKE